MGDKRGGYFTSRPRCASLGGHVHWYPEPYDIYSAVQQIVDRHNKRVSRSCQADIIHKWQPSLYLISACTHLGMVNGRVSRLLVNYILETQNPYPSIHTNYDMFVKCLISARQPGGDISELVHLIQSQTQTQIKK